MVVWGVDGIVKDRWLLVSYLVNIVSHPLTDTVNLETCGMYATAI